MLAGRKEQVQGSGLPGQRAALGWLMLAPVLAGAVALVIFTAAPGRDSAGRAGAYPAELVTSISPDIAGYRQPADAVELGAAVYSVDTGNNRILVQDSAGQVLRVIDGSFEGQPALKAPMSIASDGRYLYVANSGAGQVLVLEPDGRFLKSVDLPLGEGANGLPARPVGVAAMAEGAFVVSDPDNNRLLYFSSEGNLVRILGGARAAGGEGFNAPTGLAAVSSDVYVVDTLNGRVVKIAPDGTHLQDFGRPGDTAGTLSRPKDVAVDARGNVYVSDTLLAAVQVFSSDGTYLGFIGREDPENAGSGPLFTAPAGLSLAGDKLLVTDRFAGLFTFDVSR